MIFLTVGTQLPFDRLVEAVDAAVGKGILDEEVFAQIGESNYSPCNFKAMRAIQANIYEKFMNSCTSVISHSGMGTIEAALRCQKPLLVLPRQKKYGEAVNDHQVAIARRFEAEGYILAAHNETEIEQKLRQLKTFVPRKRTSSSQAIAMKINQFLNAIEKEIYEYSEKR